MSLLISLLINAAALVAATWLFEGITLTGADTTEQGLTLLVVAAIFGVVNAIVRPVVKVLSLPLYVLTLGLIAFVINALMLLLTSWISGQLGVSFHVDGFWTALGGSIVISIVVMLLGAVLKDQD
ncbi:MAG TPA: phage holin family protein [Nocardioidaceae bacterium]|nr:phage holin family protein [Nocardioidaceae bacterium]